MKKAWTGNLSKEHARAQLGPWLSLGGTGERPNSLRQFFLSFGVLLSQ